MKRLCMGCMREYDDQFDLCPHCGYVFNSPPEQGFHIVPGTILNNRYIVGKVLGFGGFGVTYIGWDYIMARKVAIKEYLPSEFATRMPMQEKVTVYSGDREKGFREGMEKMMNEAKRLARFDSVPGIVQIYDCFEANGTSYLVMEYLEGMTLKQYLDQHGEMPLEYAMPVVLQIASAMEAVHRLGILHRDIAPDNVYVLNPDEPSRLQVKLLDFGAARYATTKHSKSLSVIIKQGYAPEEQYSSHGEQGPWSDVYALAATFYKMLTGITPEDAMERGSEDKVKRPSKLKVDIPKATETALMNAMNVKAQDRTQSMREFMEELTEGEVEERTVTKTPGDPIKLPKWLFVLGGTGVAIALATILLMITGVIHFRMDSGESHLDRNMVRVPNVINKEVEQAEMVLRRQGIEMVRDKAVYSSEIPENMVCYQEIKENTPVEKYSSLVVWISKGEEMAVLPFVKGLSREEAQKLLEKMGFFNVQIEESQEQGAYDSVLDISEEQGAQVSLSKKIVLTVCINEENREGNSSQSIQVPYLVGKTKEEARLLLEEKDFLINVVEEFSERPEGIVIRQNPGQGETCNKGIYVTLYISRGPEKVYVENVSLMTEAEATRTIEGQGLIMGNISRKYHDTIPAGKVISQSIEANREVPKGTAIALMVSKGKDPEKEAQEKARRESEEAKAGSEKGQSEAFAAEAEEARRQAEAAAAEEARRQSEAAAAEEARRQAEAAAAEEARRQAEASAQAAMQSEAVPQTAAVVQAETAAQTQAAQTNPDAQPEDSNSSNVVSASGKRTVSQNVKMKNLAGMTLEDAIGSLERNELKLGSVSYVYSDTVEEGCVISQSIAPRKEVKRGSSVNLTVSKGAGF